MKFLILFAAAALFASVQCDEECFRAIYKECVGDPVPLEEMTLCGEVRFQMDCVYKKALECKMPFWRYSLELRSGVDVACTVKDWYDKDKACYINALNDSKCDEQIIKVMSNVETNEDYIKANKKVCNLFEDYQDCVQKIVEKDCHGTVLSQNLFNNIFNPHRKLSSAVCQQLIIPADEKDDRPDNFGMLNVYGGLLAIFAAA